MIFNRVAILKRVRQIIKDNPSSSLCQAKFITDFIVENFKAKKLEPKTKKKS